MPFRRAVWTARNRWRTLFANFAPRLLARNLPGLLRADLAHARRLGVAGVVLPFLVWPWLPFLAVAARNDSDLLRRWPSVGPLPPRIPAAAAGS